ncbi:MAG: ABC transporter ATP-binding protein [Piscinibacter sp.]|uniref:ABC transporter ATP-binding protein n=1 Tax=Piscinibacter sp. TaxID=1903157 RepID=UPI00258B13EB|nr:ABC transporter ATP-binding protein [Piscinibacter sp.]MCW5662676.1 ABC transporter ATP-binding protein [Piscinibacter sp.]
MAELHLQGLDKRFGEVQAVHGLSLEVASGEFIVLLGPSGAGKTTTLRLVAGLETPDAGQVHIGGHDVTRLAPALRDVTFVFQQYSLYPHLNVYDNLAFPLRSPLRRTPEAQIRRKVTEVATLLRIADKLDNPATRLSGGQMQRVAIGRALVREPAVTLMDEPLSSLDAKLRNDLRLELKRIQQDLGATLLYVTHDQTEAMTLADRIGVLDHGALVQVGTPREIYQNPVSAYVAARLGSPRINLLPRAAAGSLPAPAAAATIGVRPDGATLAPANGHDRGHAQALVRRVEHLGDQKHVYVALGGAASDVELVTLCGDTSGLEPGRAVSVDFRAPLFFDAAGRRIHSGVA